MTTIIEAPKRSGAAARRKRFPRKKRPVLFHYAKDSAYYAKACFSGNWSESIWSQDTPNNYIPRSNSREYSDAEKVLNLQKRLESGKNIPFNLFACDVAYIAAKHDGYEKAVCYFRPGQGWYESAAFTPKKAALPAGQSPWKLWMAGSPAFQLPGRYDDPDFRHFADNLPNTRPDLAERFCDPDTGEIPPDFLMAAWLGQVAKSRALLHPKAFLYRSGVMSLRVDLSCGALCPLKGGSAWVNRMFFQK